MNLNLMQTMLDQGFISCKKHDEHSLYIYNYTAKTQYERMWNELTLQCRGLILDEQGNIKARPFAKFFNLEECTNIPSGNFDVYEKMDGSLGILYWVDQTPYIATRGSFHSEQAIKATHLLHTKYRDCWHTLNPNYTYLFEIIYPENRIVVNYGDQEALVLLAVLDTQTGRELPLEGDGFPVVKRYDGFTQVHALKAVQEDNKEGFVVRFEDGSRIKVKFEEYVRLHYLITEVSSRTIWEYLSQGLSIEPLLQAVPDEFYHWVQHMIQELQQAYQDIYNRCEQQFKVLDTRKETAIYFLSCEYPSVLFLMLDGKSVNQEIWKRVKPDFTKPFKQDKE